MDGKKLEIYRGVEGEIVFNVDKNEQTIWATQAQIAELFGVQRAAITKHLNNIFNTGELEKNTVCSILEHTAGDGKKYKTMYYNLDAIISVGYRVNSRKATDFRIWATKVLKSYVIDGVAVNENRLKELDEKKLKEIEGVLGVVKRLINKNVLESGEMNGMLEIISRYAGSLKTMREFNEGHISFKKTGNLRRNINFIEVENLIENLRERERKSGDFGEFVNEDKTCRFREMVKGLETEKSGKTVAEKAVDLLYETVKGGYFKSGSEEIGAILFVFFLTINDIHLAENGETKISDKALTAITLLIMESEKEERGLISALVCKMLE